MMLRRILKFGALSLVGLAVLFGVLYQFFGLRMVMMGGGRPTLQFVMNPEEQAELIAQHRATQRESFEVEPSAAATTTPMLVEASSTPEQVSTDQTAVIATTPSSWTDFRGPLRNGEYNELPILTDWPAKGLQPIWKQPIGGGYASFTISHGRAFTIEQRGREEVVAAYDVATGQELWTNTWPAFFAETLGGNGPRATPTLFDGLVYALGAEGELRCLDEETGQVRWRTNILEDAGANNVLWGMSASPLIVDETVIVLPGGSNGRSVVAYNRHDGATVWTALDDRAAYASPMLVTLGGVRQLLVFTAERLAGLTPNDGTLLWDYPWGTYNDIVVAQPLLLGNGRVFISSSYGTGAAVVEISASGDTLGAREVWRSNRMKNKFTSSVLYDGFIYGLDEAILACIDPATGELQWKGGRYGYGQVMLASGHLIVLTEDGDLALVRATPGGHDELARFPVLDSKTWNHPAMDGGYLLVRSLGEMAAFDLRQD